MFFFMSRLSKQILTVDSRSKAFGVVDFALLREKKNCSVVLYMLISGRLLLSPAKSTIGRNKSDQT